MLPEEGGGDAAERERVAGLRARKDWRLPPRRFVGAVRASEVRPPPKSPTLPEPPILLLVMRHCQHKNRSIATGTS